MTEHEQKQNAYSQIELTQPSHRHGQNQNGKLVFLQILSTRNLHALGILAIVEEKQRYSIFNFQFSNKVDLLVSFESAIQPVRD